jgi:hypothetical protein
MRDSQLLSICRLCTMEYTRKNSQREKIGIFEFIVCTKCKGLSDRPTCICFLWHVFIRYWMLIFESGFMSVVFMIILNSSWYIPRFIRCSDGENNYLCLYIKRLWGWNTAKAFSSYRRDSMVRTRSHTRWRRIRNVKCKTRKTKNVFFRCWVPGSGRSARNQGHSEHNTVARMWRL